MLSAYDEALALAEVGRLQQKGDVTPEEMERGKRMMTMLAPPQLPAAQEADLLARGLIGSNSYYNPDLPPVWTWKGMGEMGPLSGAIGEKELKGAVPFVGGFLNGGDIKDVREAIDRLKADAEDPGARVPPVKAHDRALVGRFVTEGQYREMRGVKWTGEVARSALQLLPYAIEFWATQGMAKVGQSVVMRTLGSGIQKATTAGSAARAVGTRGLQGAVAVGRGVARMPAFGGMTYEGQQERMLGGQEAVPATLAALGSTLIELVSEESGEALAAGVGRVGRFVVPKGARKAIAGTRAVKAAGSLKTKLNRALGRVWQSTGRPPGTFARVLKNAGYDGILEEVGEERFGDALRALTNTDDFGLSEDENTLLARLSFAIPSLRQLSVELATFAIPGAMHAAGGEVGARADARTVRKVILTPYGAASVAAAHPEAAREYVATPNPSRRALATLWGDTPAPLHMNAKDREKFRVYMEEHLEWQTAVRNRRPGPEETPLLPGEAPGLPDAAMPRPEPGETPLLPGETPPLPQRAGVGETPLLPGEAPALPQRVGPEETPLLPGETPPLPLSPEEQMPAPRQTAAPAVAIPVAERPARAEELGVTVYRQQDGSVADAYLTDRTDVDALVAAMPDAEVLVKDANGFRALMRVSDFAGLRKLPAFDERTREVLLRFESRAEGIDANDGFMEGVLKEKPAKLLADKDEAPLMKVEAIPGVTLESNATVRKDRVNLFQAAVADPTIRTLLEELDITRVTIDAPYKFELSGQGEVDLGAHHISLNADVTDPKQTLMHELGHVIWDKMPAADQKALLAAARASGSEALQGYIGLGLDAEVAAEAFAEGLVVAEGGRYVFKAAPQTLPAPAGATQLAEGPMPPAEAPAQQGQPVAAREGAPAVREPWEMTQREYVDSRSFIQDVSADLARDDVDSSIHLRALRPDQTVADAARGVHQSIVFDAVYKGKYVPRGVLENYKDEEWAQEALRALPALTGEQGVAAVQREVAAAAATTQEVLDTADASGEFEGMAAEADGDLVTIEGHKFRRTVGAEEETGRFTWGESEEQGRGLLQELKGAGATVTLDHPTEDALPFWRKMYAEGLISEDPDRFQTYEEAADSANEVTTWRTGAEPPSAHAVRMAESGKEPWEMTREEFVGPDTNVDAVSIRTSAHANHVDRAVAEGKPVPREVLEQYRNNGWAQEALERMDAAAGEIDAPAPPAQPAAEAPGDVPTPEGVAPGPSNSLDMPPAGTPTVPNQPYSIDLDTVVLNPKRWQFKLEAAKDTGDTGVLKDVDTWEAADALNMRVWRNKGGSIEVVDGHQRTNLNQRLRAEGKTEEHTGYATVYEAANGWTPVRARVDAALANIRAGTASPWSVAQVIRDSGFSRADLVERGIPITHTAAVQAAGMTKDVMTQAAFDYMIQEGIDPGLAQWIGKEMPKAQAETQVAVLEYMQKQLPLTQQEARFLVRASNLAPTTTKKDMFGAFEVGHVAETAKVTSHVVSTLRKMATTSKRVVASKGFIENVSSSSIDANTLKAIQQDAQLLADLVERMGHLKGPIANIVTAGVETYVERPTPKVLGQVTADIVAQIQKIDFSTAYGGQAASIVHGIVMEGEGDVEGEAGQGTDVGRGGSARSKVRGQAKGAASGDLFAESAEGEEGGPGVGPVPPEGDSYGGRNADGGAAPSGRDAPAPGAPFVGLPQETRAGKRLMGRLQKDIGRGAKAKIGIRSIMDGLNRVIHMELRVGKTQLSKGKPGRYWPGPHMARSMTDDWIGNLHEAGHGLSFYLQDTQPGIWDSMRDDLEFVASMEDSMASAETAEEGMAELVRRYIDDYNSIPDNLRTRFETRVQEAAPTVLSGLRDTHRAWVRHSQRSYEERMAAMENDRPTKAQLRDSLKAMKAQAMYGVFGGGASIQRIERAAFLAASGQRGIEAADPTGLINLAHRLVSRAHRKRLADARRLKKATTDSPSDMGSVYNSSLHTMHEVARVIGGDKAGNNGVRVRMMGDGLWSIPAKQIQTLRAAGFNVPKAPGHGHWAYLTGQAVCEIRNEVGLEDWGAFSLYAQSRAMLMRWENKGHEYPGRTSDLPPEAVARQIAAWDEAHPTWGTTFEGTLREHFDALLLMSAMSGELSVTDAVTAREAWTDFVPLPRQAGSAHLPTGQTVPTPQSIFRARGSSKALRTLDEALESHTARAYEAYDLNRLIESMIRWTREVGANEAVPFDARKSVRRLFVELKMDPDLVAKLRPDEQAQAVANYLNATRAAELDVDVDGLPAGETVKPGDLDIVTPGQPVWRHKSPRARYVVAQFDKGEKRFYEVGDPVIFDILRGPGNLPAFLKVITDMAHEVNKPTKELITQNIGFAAVNTGPRDMINVMFMGQGLESLIPGFNAVHGLVKWITGADRSEMSGTELLSRADSTIHDRLHQHFVASVKDMLLSDIVVPGYSEMGPWEKMAHGPKQALAILGTGLRVFNYATFGPLISAGGEMLPRRSAFYMERKRGYSPEYAQRAFDMVSGRFIQKPGGTAMPPIIGGGAFLNASLQILGGHIERFTDADPAKRAFTTAKIGYIGALGGCVAAASIALIYMLVPDPEEREELLEQLRQRPAKERTRYFVVGPFKLPIDKGIPGAAFMVGYNAVQGWLLGDGMDAGELAKEALKNAASVPLVGDVVPMLMQTAIDLGRNYDNYFEQYIVPRWMEEKYPDSPQWRTWPTMPDVWNAIGKGLKVSPIHVRFAARQMFTRQLTDSVKLVDNLAKGRPVDAANLPLLSRLVERERRGWSSKSVQTLAELDQRYAQLKTTLKDIETRETHGDVSGSKAEAERDRVHVAMAELEEAHQTLWDVERLWAAVKKERAKPKPDYELMKKWEHAMTTRAREFMRAVDEGHKLPASAASAPFLGRHLYALSSPRPAKRKGEVRDAYKARWTKWARSIARARMTLRRYDFSDAGPMGFLIKEAKRRGYSTRSEAFRARGRRMMGWLRAAQQNAP